MERSICPTCQSEHLLYCLCGHVWRTASVGYAGDNRKLPYRRMTISEAQRLGSGDTVSVLAHNGVLRRAKVNGQPKTWKRDAGRVRVPMKYGMYDYFAMEPDFVDPRYVTYGVILADGQSI